AMGRRPDGVAPPRRGCVLMVGGAAGFFDPLSGEGIFNGLRSAEMATETAVQALGRGDVSARALAGYERARRLATRDKEHVTHALQIVVSHRRLANLAARFLPRRPRLLHLLLRVLGDFVPPRPLLTRLR